MAFRHLFFVSLPLSACALRFYLFSVSRYSIFFGFPAASSPASAMTETGTAKAADTSPVPADCVAFRRHVSCFPPTILAHMAACSRVLARHVGGNMEICANSAIFRH
jgi:hypothetical protein